MRRTAREKPPQTYPLSPELERRKAEFLEAAERRQEHIRATRYSEAIAAPVLRHVRARLREAKLAEQDSAADMPACTTFDLYTAFKRTAANDRGAIHAREILRKEWDQDPTGHLTYRRVAEIRAQIASAFPGSSAPKALDGVISRIGFHQMPIARMARIASAVQDADSLESVLASYGYADDSLESRRVRAFVTGLARLRGVQIETAAPEAQLSPIERVMERIKREAQMMEQELAGAPTDPLPPPGTEDEADQPPPVGPGSGPEPELDMPPDSADAGQDLMQEINDAISSTVDNAPPEAQPFIQQEQQELAEQGYPGVQVGSAAYGAIEMLEGHKGIPGAPGPEGDLWVREEAAEHAGGSLGDPPPLSDTTKIASADPGLEFDYELAEKALLSGATLRVASVSLRINDADELELTDTSTGEPRKLIASLEDMDRALSDFHELTAPRIPEYGGLYTVAEAVDVFCRACEGIHTTRTASVGYYNCECGHSTPAPEANAIHAMVGAPRKIIVRASVKPSYEEVMRRIAEDWGARRDGHVWEFVLDRRDAPLLARRFRAEPVPLPGPGKHKIMVFKVDPRQVHDFTYEVLDRLAKEFGAKSSGDGQVIVPVDDEHEEEIADKYGRAHGLVRVAESDWDGEQFENLDGTEMRFSIPDGKSDQAQSLAQAYGGSVDGSVLSIPVRGKASADRAIQQARSIGLRLVGYHGKIGPKVARVPLKRFRREAQVDPYAGMPTPPGGADLPRQGANPEPVAPPPQKGGGAADPGEPEQELLPPLTPDDIALWIRGRMVEEGGRLPDLITLADDIKKTFKDRLTPELQDSLVDIVSNMNSM